MAAPTTSVLWTVAAAAGNVVCTFAAGCANVEVVVRQGDTVLAREVHPDRATALERARLLRAGYESLPGTGGRGPLQTQ